MSRPVTLLSSLFLEKPMAMSKTQQQLDNEKMDALMRHVNATQVKQAANPFISGNLTVSNNIISSAGIGSTTSKNFNINVEECENGYIIHASYRGKYVTRVATSEDLMDQMAACMGSLKLD